MVIPIGAVTQEVELLVELLVTGRFSCLDFVIRNKKFTGKLLPRNRFTPLTLRQCGFLIAVTGKTGKLLTRNRFDFSLRGSVVSYSGTGKTGKLVPRNRFTPFTSRQCDFLIVVTGKMGKLLTRNRFNFSLCGSVVSYTGTGLF